MPGALTVAIWRVFVTIIHTGTEHKYCWPPEEWRTTDSVKLLTECRVSELLSFNSGFGLPDINVSAGLVATIPSCWPLPISDLLNASHFPPEPRQEELQTFFPKKSFEFLFQGSESEFLHKLGLLPLCEAERVKLRNPGRRGASRPN